LQIILLIFEGCRHRVANNLLISTTKLQHTFGLSKYLSFWI